MDVYRRTENGVVTYYAKLFSNGKLVRRSTGTGSKREAVMRARAMQAELDDQTAPVTGSMTHVTAWSIYEGWASSRRRARTVDNYRIFWNQFWLWAPTQNLYAVTPEMALAWRTKMMTTPSRFGRPLAAHSTNDYLRCMSTIYAQLATLGYTGTNPFTAEQCPREATGKRRPSYLTAAEVQVAMVAAEKVGRDTHLFLALGTYAGLRKGELLNLRWRDVDWDRAGDDGVPIGCLYVWGTEGHQVKTAASSAVVPLHPALKELLSHYRPIHLDLDDYIVRPDVTMRRLSGYRWDPRKSLSIVGAAVGRRINPHMLRHTFASLLAQKGVSLYKISAWLRHENISTTEVYAHLCPVDSEISRL
jgi:integrase